MLIGNSPFIRGNSYEFLSFFPFYFSSSIFSLVVADVGVVNSLSVRETQQNPLPKLVSCIFVDCLLKLTFSNEMKIRRVRL